MRTTFHHAAQSAVVGRFAFLPLGSLLFAVLLAWPVLAAASGANAQNAALQLILDAAKGICQEPLSHGQYQDIRIQFTDPTASVSGSYNSQHYDGVQSKDVFQVNEQIINCKLKVISKLVENLLPGAAPSDSTATKSLEVTDDPGTITNEIIEEVCRLRIGMSERNVKGECEHSSCNIKIETKISYSPFTVYLKP